MVKSWKNLFIKEDEQREEEMPKSEKKAENLSFPVTSASNSTPVSVPAFSSKKESAPQENNETLKEILEVYANGLESINMPGYDFYEFYSAVISIGASNEQIYKMAFQMAQTMDKTITASKLTGDADFYISKIKEVHQQYAGQGKKKLDALVAQKNTEKEKLVAEIEAANAEIKNLQERLRQLEAKVNDSNRILKEADQRYEPLQASVEDKLKANDMAMEISVEKLISVKDGISRYLTK